MITQKYVNQIAYRIVGCAIEVMEKDKADELLTLFAELEEAEAEWSQKA